MKASMTTPFGQNIRAFRLGYRIFNGQYFLRISREKALFRIDIAPLSGVNDRRKTMTGEHFRWWDAEDDGRSLVWSIPCLRSVVAAHRPISFLVTSTGEYAGT